MRTGMSDAELHPGGVPEGGGDVCVGGEVVHQQSTQGTHKPAEQPADVCSDVTQARSGEQQAPGTTSREGPRGEHTSGTPSGQLGSR